MQRINYLSLTDQPSIYNPLKCYVADEMEGEWLLPKTNVSLTVGIYPISINPHSVKGYVG